MNSGEVVGSLRRARAAIIAAFVVVIFMMVSCAVVTNPIYEGKEAAAAPQARRPRIGVSSIRVEYSSFVSQQSQAKRSRSGRK